MSRQKYVEDICRSSLQASSHIHNVRSLLYTKSFTVFDKLHDDIEEDKANGRSIGKRIHEAAKEYGNILRDQIQHVEQWFHDPALQKERTFYLEMLSIWSLCEILYFAENDDNLSIKLMDWFNDSNQPLAFEFDKQAIYYHDEGAFEHPDFWAYATRLALLGQLSQLSALLKHALINVSFSRYNSVLALVLEVRNITNEEQIDTVKLSKAMITLRQAKFIDPKAKEHADQLYKVMAILAGDEEVIMKYATSDIHAFIASVYYSPTNKMPIHTRANLFFSRYPQFSPGTEQALLVGDIPQAIEQGIRLDWWLLAILTDLFQLMNVFDRHVSINVDNDTILLETRDHFIMYYASFIYNKFGLWREAFGYMARCNLLGKDLIAEHVKNMNVSEVDDAQIQEMVEYCRRLSLKETGWELCRAKANDCMERRDYNGALKYYKQGRKQKGIDKMFHTIVEDFIMKGTLFNVELLGPIEKQTPYYIICRGLHKMNSLYNHGHEVEAAREFMKLIQEERIPKSIMSIILWEGLKLIEGEGIAGFSTSDILLVKKIWQNYSQKIPYTCFRLFYFYIQKDKNKSLAEDPTAEMVIKAQANFLNTIGVSFCRALERVSDK